MELWLKGLLEIVGKLKFLHNNLQKIKEERIPLLFFVTLFHDCFWHRVAIFSKQNPTPLRMIPHKDSPVWNPILL